MGEHPLTEHVDIDDIPATDSATPENLRLWGGTNCPCHHLGYRPRGSTKRIRWYRRRRYFEDELSASEYEADDLWLEEQNASMADVQFWWIDGDEADLIALGEALARLYLWVRRGFDLNDLRDRVLAVLAGR